MPTTSFLAAWFAIHLAALGWMVWEVARAGRK